MLVQELHFKKGIIKQRMLLTYTLLNIYNLDVPAVSTCRMIIKRLKLLLSFF